MKNKEAMEEIGYIYTTMISSLFLAAILLATSNTTNEIIKMNASNEIRETTFKIVSSINDLSIAIYENPNASYELTVELPKTGKSYFYVISLNNSDKAVRVNSSIGITFQMNLHNVRELNLNETSVVSSSFSLVKVIYLNKDNQKSIIIKGA